jgi:cohesin loading factor subunit SCC2
MAENLSAFDYKTQEEVLIIIRQITNVLSVAGMQLLEILSPSNLMAQLADILVCCSLHFSDSPASDDLP